MLGQNLESTNQLGARERPPLLNQKEYNDEKEKLRPKASNPRAHAVRDGRMGMVYCNLILRTDRCVMIIQKRKSK